MITRIELKAQAKLAVRRKTALFFLIGLIATLISGAAAFVLGLIPKVGTVIGPLVSMIVITPAFSLSIVRIFLKLTPETRPAIADIFSGFDDFWSAFKVDFLRNLFTILWSILLVVPGIIKNISYSQAMYILAENPGMGAREAITRSRKMMNGHKWEYFVLTLSFIGWSILGSITGGIAFIWIAPYMAATYANYYKALSASYNETCGKSCCETCAE